MQSHLVDSMDYMRSRRKCCGSFVSHISTANLQSCEKITRERKIISYFDPNDCPKLTHEKPCNLDSCTIDPSNGYTTYVRWGETTCREGSSLLSTGYAAKYIF